LIAQTPEVPRLTFQEHVYSLVCACNSGIWLEAKEAAERQQRIFALLNPVYSIAVRRADIEPPTQHVNPVKKRKNGH
jgi:hypothetical protein